MEPAVLLSIDNGVARIKFNRPQSLNSLNAEMAQGLEMTTHQLMHEEKVRCVILSGAGNSFMSGGDVKFFFDNIDQMPTGVAQVASRVNTAISNLAALNKPVIASVHGAVAGVGMSFMMAADLVIAADTSTFTLAYANIGTTPDGGATYFLPRLVGTRRAMELMLLADRFDAQRALNLGLINWVVKPASLEDETDRIAQRLATGPTLAYGRTKQLLQNAWVNNLDTQLEDEARTFAMSTTTTDFRAGVNAFVNKHKARFEGK